MMKCRAYHLINAIVFFPALMLFVRAGEEELESLIMRLNSDVIELRNEVESSIETRCDSISGCWMSSYHECQSAYTQLQTCPSESELGIVFAQCGAGIRCNGLIDFSVSTVRIPANLAKGPNQNPTNPNVIEDVCMTAPTQRWMVKKYASDRSFWSSLDVAPPQMYFGADTGVFRIYPARQSQECGVYDPRTRPWYQAALPSTISTKVKPRRVVIILDTSRSMGDPLITGSNQTKLAYMQQTVKAVLNTLSPNDSIAVIRFAEVARLVDQPMQLPPYLWEKATTNTVNNIIDEVNKLEVNGRSNWEEAFGFAFDLIQDSLKSIAAVDVDSSCDLENIAVMFFSDGQYNLPDRATDKSIVNFVSTKVDETKAMGDNSVFMFLYSLGYNDPSGPEKKISCAVDGYWKALTVGVSPVNATNGYHVLFSTPMGTDAFYNYTTWSQPYNFSSGRLGYTVSALVYDRQVEPPRFKGAVGMDVSVDAAMRVYNGSETETAIAIKTITDNITNRDFAYTCDQQRIDLSPCEIQSLRHYSGGTNALCSPTLPQAVATTPTIPATLPSINGNATTNVTVENILDDIDFITDAEVSLFELLNCSKAFVPNCPGYDEYPTKLWRNVDNAGQTYQDRVCCKVGTNETSDDCPELDEVSDKKISNAAIFGILFASIVVVEIVGCYFCFYARKRRRADT